VCVYKGIYLAFSHLVAQINNYQEIMPINMFLEVDIISPNADERDLISSNCEEAGWKTGQFPSLENYFTGSGEGAPPLVILSIPEGWDRKRYRKVVEAVSQWREKNKQTQLLVLFPKDFSGIDKAAIELGARHTLFKPYKSEDMFGLLGGVAQGIGKRRHREALSKVSDNSGKGFESIIGVSDSIKEVLALSKKVAESETTSIMVTGENGTGKGALAKAIHSVSSRSGGPFIEVNCAAIPKALLESEFFGHEKGAFTDAKDRKIGLFECANGGTIFLDEVGEIDYKLQAKLLKFLDSRTIRRVSGTQFLPVDVRIISATNRNLKRDVEDKRFRADLFYRLNVVEINIPPLRDRTEDIEPIARHYTGKFSSRLNKGEVKLSEEAVDTLKRYSWPGNIRELINIIERAVLLDRTGTIEADDLPINPSTRDITVNVRKERETIRIDLPPEGISYEEIERAVITDALVKSGCNITAAGRYLELERGTLRYKMKKYGIKISDIKKILKNGQYEPAFSK